ncbi:MAG: hypothetical protein A2W98_08935 [Bacteroidetes bacterium GWF2_33_38]|nr:MAG: hypothetical protein A2W98_08935 [Bacteroidetes bacterium GWF2_33_38]OFY68568.1 MAG: hypothetical protein A2265_01610 [Bacteroidetes bacterium RIFOXYA12_FULL_33_9]OFY87349.1 MAG: hypothetical protein A2236_12570 [Bacteroidetes bacterium RIFOXYA2_FULL_33_7]
MLDFKELSEDGNELELLIREILLVKGYKVNWSGKGPDGGKDLICYENRKSDFLDDIKTWLIQCKHKAKSEGAVSISDLDDIVDSCSHHEAKGYLLICSTYPSSKVVERIEGITNNSKLDIECTYWDSVRIEQILSTPKMWSIAQRFFPKSSKNSSWELFATSNPSNWIANYRGYYFHLSNRIGSTVDWHFESIDKRIQDINKIELPKEHFIRIRAVWFNDKSGEYLWFLDYMHPYNQEPKYRSIQIAKELGDGYALEDGQFYSFDVITRSYSMYSDHYDKDHYDYYEPFLYNYQNGSHRELDSEKRNISWSDELALEKENEKLRDDIFNRLTESVQSLEILHLAHSTNCQIEKIHKFYNYRDWTEIVEKVELQRDLFFTVLFVLIVKENNRQKFFDLVRFFPQDGFPSYRLTNAIITTPNFETGGSDIDLDDNEVFELELSIPPEMSHNSYNVRVTLNTYMEKFISSIEKYKSS